MSFLLKAMGLPKSSYYYEIKRIDRIKERNSEVTSEIKAVFEEHRGKYGVRRVHQELRNRGLRINHKRVQRIMHQCTLAGKRPKEKYHSYKGNVGKVADNIINRNFQAERPLQKWTTDVTQFNLPWGKCYLSPILDMKTNELRVLEFEVVENNGITERVARYKPTCVYIDAINDANAIRKANNYLFGVKRSARITEVKK